jgi:hypothetical protein
VMPTSMPVSHRKKELDKICINYLNRKLITVIHNVVSSLHNEA